MEHLTGAAVDPSQMNPLTLAFVGDGVYELFVRETMVAGAGARVRDLHTKAVSRVRCEAQAKAAREVLLVLDGTTGQNGLIQAREFKNIAGVTAVALTKLDGTAKGGIVIAVSDSLGLPVKFVGVGEQADDLMPFEPQAFVDALL